MTKQRWLICEDVPDARVGYRAIVDRSGFVICNPSPMGADDAALIAAAPDLRDCLVQAVAVIEDFMPNIGRCALQDYGRLNDVLKMSAKLLRDTKTPDVGDTD